MEKGFFIGMRWNHSIAALGVHRVFWSGDQSEHASATLEFDYDTPELVTANGIIKQANRVTGALVQTKTATGRSMPAVDATSAIREGIPAT